MKRVVVVCAVGLALGGCMTRARQEQQIAEAGPKEDAFCRSIGAKPGSDAYVNCRTTMRQELLRSQAQERDRNSRVGDALIAAGGAISAGRPTLNCQSSTFMGQTTTTCN